ncbi:LOW QUALITY PROTEIN: uncharacterized protein ACR2FA_004613 [Aphomia sociella]
MEATTSIKPKTMAELLPGLSGILTKDAMQTLTARKQPRPTIAQTRTAEKVLKPLTIAEMRADIQALKVQSPRRFAQGDPTTKKKIWNSSVKVDKKISHTADGQMKNNPVRKVLNFQSKPKNITNSRVTMHHQAIETPKFPKPDFRAKKSLLQARNTVRISGVCNIPETPVIAKTIKSRMTLANKENFSNQSNVTKEKKPVIQRPATKKIMLPQLKVPDTPLSNESWKSSCDASFLQREKEINDIEMKVQAITEEQTLENIVEVSPPVSTPFKEYRNVKEYFNNSSELENSALYCDNTIMCFDKPSVCNEVNNREESVIVSLCDLLNKATVTNQEKSSTELDDLFQVEKQTEHNIKIIENGIRALNTIKESQLKSLKYVKKLIHDKTKGQTSAECEKDKTLTNIAKVTPKVVKNEFLNIETNTIQAKPCSVIKPIAKSPSYKIPKKNCLRKKYYKSMPNVSNTIESPNKGVDTRALNMYMKMKEQMNFLNTPLVKHRNSTMPDTPAVTSHNLQRQLDKLYGGS